MRLEIEPTLADQYVTDEPSNGNHGVDSVEAKSALNQGIKAAQAGNRSQARTSLLRATELDPRSESAWLWLASISEYPEELLGFLNHVLEINPENERATEWKAATHALLSKTFVQRGIDASQENQKDFASECFQTALEYNEHNADAWLWLAALADINTVKVSLLEKALEVDPDNRSALAAMETAKASILKERLTEAKSAAVSGKNGEAIRILDALLVTNSDSVEAWTMRSHLSEGFDEKIRCFESILAIDPSNVAAKAGRDSLLEIFGTAEAANSPVDAVEYLEAVEEESIDKSPTQDLEMPPAFSEVSYEAPVEPAETHFEEQNENEYMDSREEPFASFATETEEPAETVHEAEQLAFADDTPATFNTPATDYEEADDFSQSNVLAFPPREEVHWNDVAEAAAEEDSFSSEDVSFDERMEHAFTPVEESPVVPEDSYPAPQEVADEPAYADHQSETVSFSYDEVSSDQLSTPNDEPVGFTSSPEIPMPETELPLESQEASNDPFKTIVDVAEVLEAKPESVECPFCGQSNEPQNYSCHSCMAVLTLSDLELLLANHDADKLTLRHAVEAMERGRMGRDFGPAELVTLGIGHLNLRNLQLGYTCLLEASKLDPNNVVLAGQVNALLIRLDEIKQQEEAHLKMPKGKSILVVDDSATVRKLISGKLEKCGHDVICANDGVEAMERLEHFVPDLVLLDITMPRMDGYQVCKTIRSNNSTKDVPVVMISGKDGFFDKVRGRMAGTTGYITKPFGPETLMKAVEMYLRGEVPESDEV